MIHYFHLALPPAPRSLALTRRFPSSSCAAVLSVGDDYSMFCAGGEPGYDRWVNERKKTFLGEKCWREKSKINYENLLGAATWVMWWVMIKLNGVSCQGVRSLTPSEWWERKRRRLESFLFCEVKENGESNLLMQKIPARYVHTECMWSGKESCRA